MVEVLSSCFISSGILSICAKRISTMRFIPKTFASLDTILSEGGRLVEVSIPERYPLDELISSATSPKVNPLFLRASWIVFPNTYPIAGRFLNGRLDLFQALTVGDIRIGGQMPMLDAISLILDRIPLYLTL